MRTDVGMESGKLASVSIWTCHLGTCQHLGYDTA